MSECVKCEDAIKYLKEIQRLYVSEDKRIKQVIDMLSADVVEIRHGHWKILRPRSLRLDRRDNLFECSECGANRIRRTGEVLNYCPNCGAKMDGKEQEHE